MGDPIRIEEETITKRRVVIDLPDDIQLDTWYEVTARVYCSSIGQTSHGGYKLHIMEPEE